MASTSHDLWGQFAFNATLSGEEVSCLAFIPFEPLTGDNWMGALSRDRSGSLDYLTVIESILYKDDESPAAIFWKSP